MGRTGSAVTVASSLPVEEKMIHLTIDGEKVRNCCWKSVNGKRFDVMWKTDLANNEEVLDNAKLEFKLDDTEEILELNPGPKKDDDKAVVFVKGREWKSGENRFDRVPEGDVTRTVLEQELENCHQLLELEPDSKWTLYTAASLMAAIDSHKHHKQILDILDKLVEVDVTRKGYYEDVRSKFIIEFIIETTDDLTEVLDLTGQRLTKIYHPEYLSVFRKVVVDSHVMERNESVSGYFVCDRK